MKVITKRRPGLFFKIIVVIFIILYFNIILPSDKSSSSISSLSTNHSQEVTDIHLAPTVLQFLMQSNGDDVLFVNKIAALFIPQGAKTLLPKTTFINLYVFRPWCALTTINAP